MGAEENIGLRFIIDEPADVDFFNTHTPVASAISQAITTNPELKIIGLLGRWGSGKSTIVKEVADKLHKSDESYLSFTYDAWLHQHDPLRRSFLESLVRFLKNTPGELIDQDQWEKRLKKLSGSLEVVDKYETPLVTSEAKLFFVLGSAFAMGLSFLGKDTFRDAFGETVTRAGSWTFGLGATLVLGSALIWTARILLLKYQGREANFFPSLILNKNFEHINTQTYRQIDSTSIEFGEAFRDLMQELSKKNRKIVIIIDNIDRVDDKEAMQIWASVRSFFLSSNDDNNIESEDYHPKVILPIDGKSISHMFAMGDDAIKADRLARSFINKTFDVTFDVPAPVMSDWKRYLLDKMRYCLDAEFSEQRYFRTRQFLEAWFETSQTPITPREINKVLNRILALFMQWRESDVSFEAISYYSINRDGISEHILKEILRTDHPLSRFSAGWQRELAALNFGVSLDLAVQVLITEPIRRSILMNSPKLIEPYRKVAGFGDIFERVTADLPTDERRPTPDLEIITNAASLLVIEDPKDESSASAWKNLIAAFNEVKEHGNLQKISERILVLLDHLEEDDISEFVSTIEFIVDNLVSQDEVVAGLVPDVGILGTHVIAYCKNKDREIPVFDVTGGAQKYLTRLASLQASPEVQKQLRSRVSHDDILNDLVRRVNNELEAFTVPLLANVLTSPAAKLMINKPLESVEIVTAAAESAVRSHSGDAAIFRSALKAMASFKGFEKQHRAVFERLEQENIISNNLAAVVETGDEEAIAVMIAILIWKNGNISSPVGSFWSEFLLKFPKMPSAINSVFDNLLDALHPIEILARCYDGNYRSRDIVSAITADRVKRGKLGTLVSAKILSDFYMYSRMMSSSQSKRFVQLLANYEKFWPNVQSLPWSESLHNTAVLLRGQDSSSAKRIEREISERLQKTPKEEWIAAINQGLEPYGIATKFMNGMPLKQGVNSALLEALESSSLKAAQGSLLGIRRWFDLADVLTTQARRKAMQSMAVAVLNGRATEKLKVLKAGGIRFANEANFEANPDLTVDMLVVPLAKSIKGRAWLSDRSTQIAAVIGQSSAELKKKLASIVHGYAKSNDVEKQKWGSLMSRSWKLKEPI